MSAQTNKTTAEPRPCSFDFAYSGDRNYFATTASASAVPIYSVRHGSISILKTGCVISILKENKTCICYIYIYIYMRSHMQAHIDFALCTDNPADTVEVVHPASAQHALGGIRVISWLAPQLGFGSSSKKQINKPWINHTIRHIRKNSLWAAYSTWHM